MINIPKDIVDRIFQQGTEETPVEACGYLAGKDSVVTKMYQMTNIDKSEIHFSLDPAEQFKVLKDSRSLGLDLIAIYHTHPETPARPSEEDIKLAYDPDIAYVIASLAENTKAIKGFTIINEKVSNVEIKVS